MTEGERQALAIRLYDDWQETDTSDSLEIYCYGRGYQQGQETAIKDLVNAADIICQRYSKFTNTEDAQLNARAYGIIDGIHLLVDEVKKKGNNYEETN